MRGKRRRRKGGVEKGEGIRKRGSWGEESTGSIGSGIRGSEGVEEGDREGNGN